MQSIWVPEYPFPPPFDSFLTRAGRKRRKGSRRVIVSSGGGGLYNSDLNLFCVYSRNRTGRRGVGHGKKKPYEYDWGVTYNNGGFWGQRATRGEGRGFSQWLIDAAPPPARHLRDASEQSEFSEPRLFFEGWSPLGKVDLLGHPSLA
jgi:hypothetical protein